MKLLLIVSLLMVSVNVSALTKSEEDCIHKSVYREVRGLQPIHWGLTANVIVNRQHEYSKHRFHAKSKHICDIVKSPEFPSRIFLNKPIKEKQLFIKIVNYLRSHDYTHLTTALFFNYKNGREIYS